MIQTIKADIKTAMVEKNKAKLSTLRLLLAKLEKEKVAFKLNVVEDLTEDQVITVINRNLKELDKEIIAFKAVGRDVEKQEAEIEVLKVYLPKQITGEELVKLINEAVSTSSNMGETMGKLSHLRGKVDMKKVSEEVKKRF